MTPARLAREAGRIDVGVPAALIAVVLGQILISAVTGVGFLAWPWWGKALGVLVALVVVGGAFLHDSESSWPEVDLRSPPPKEPDGEASDASGDGKPPA